MLTRQLHAERILALDEERYEPLFTQLGEEMIKREKWMIGAQLYGKLNENDNVSDDHRDTICGGGLDVPGQSVRRRRAVRLTMADLRPARADI